MKPTPSARISGGNPASAPDFRPLNPWGRGMPFVPQKPKQEMWQVVVWDRRDRREIRVGPQWPKEFAEMFASVIKRQIASGAERRWGDPVVVFVTERSI